MKLIAKDTLHISSIGPDPLRPGATFEVDAATATSLIARDLAVKAAGEPNSKPKAGHANKAAPAAKRKKKG